MAIIINDFEVIMDQPQPTQNSQTPQPSTPVSPLRPEDIARIVRHFEERKLRLLAD